MVIEIYYFKSRAVLSSWIIFELKDCFWAQVCSHSNVSWFLDLPSIQREELVFFLCNIALNLIIFPVHCLLCLVWSCYSLEVDWEICFSVFRIHTIRSAHGSFSSSSVLSNVARFLDLPSNQSEQPLLVYNETFSRVLVSRRVSCEGSILELTSSFIAGPRLMNVKGLHYLLCLQIEYLYFQCILLLLCRLAFLINSVSGKPMASALQCSLKLVIFL